MNGTSWKAWMLVLLAALACVARPAHALDIDQIVIRSQLGEPLLAEIPIIASDPAELANVKAQLASPVTFARVGLQRPQGIVAALQFSIARDGGKPVIRITSGAPVQEDFFTFLVEVDWGSGHMVREYSVALESPNALSASAQPMIQAPMVAPSNTIARDPEPAVAAIPLAGEKALPPASLPAPLPVPLQAPSPTPSPVVSRPRETTAAPAPVPRPAAKPPATPKPVAAAAAKPTPEPRPKPEQASAPKPQAKPAPLPKPAAPAAPAPAPAAAATAKATGDYAVKPGDNLSSIALRMRTEGHTRDQTMLALLRTNPGAFIGGNINLIHKGAVLDAPDAAELSRFGEAEAAVMVRDQINQWRGGQATTPQPVALAGDVAPAARTPVAVPAQPATAPARTTAARLEIVPAAAARDRARPGTRSGIEAGGSGDALRQDLQETKETLVTRDVEIQELKTRLAGLEKLQQDQQKLIELQSRELAAAQQNTGALQQRAAAESRDRGNRTPVWPWLVGAVAAIVLLAWLVTRLRDRSGPTRRVFEPEALASAQAAPRETIDPDAESIDPETHAPTWHAGDDGIEASDGGKRLKLAQAHLDLGDVAAARRVLQDVVAGDDPLAAERASKQLRELG